MTKPYSFSIFIANCLISGKYKDGDNSTHFQMNHVIPCHMLTQTTLSQWRSFFKENSATKNDEETNNNVSATLMKSLLIQKSVSMTVQKSPNHMKERPQRMSLEIYCGWWSQWKLKDHIIKGIKSPRPLLKFKVCIEWRINPTSYKDLRHKRTQRSEDQKELPRTKISSSKELKIFKYIVKRRRPQDKDL